jgi:CBS domain-containing protein
VIADTVMTRDVVCVEVDDSLTDAHQVMIEWEIRHLPVLDGKHLVGILSNRDVLARAAWTENGIVVPDVPVEEVMTAKPFTCLASTDVTSIGESMIKHKIDCLPVVDRDGELVGLVTSSDLIEILISKEQASVRRPLPFHYMVYKSVRPGMVPTAT